MDHRSPKLTMTFTPNTIEHLGIRMYSTLPPVLAELISNSYDADASKVLIKLHDEGEKNIIIEDDGHGMTFEEIETHFLRIGRNRRGGNNERSPGGRNVIGKKGLGKLSFFGIANKIKITTIKNGLRNVFVLDKNKIIKEDGEDSYRQKDYNPDILEFKKKVKQPDGTVISLHELDRETDFDEEAIAISLSKIFIVDERFRILISRNGKEFFEVSNEMRLSGLEIQFEWQIPDDIEKPAEFFREKGIKGRVVSTLTPISSKKEMRGIMLFSRGKLVNLPEFFSDSTSSHFYSYATGWLSVDFIDDIKPDVIGTNRQSLDWRHPETQELRSNLQDFVGWLYLDWRKKRAEATNKKIREITKIDIADWQSKVPDDMNKLLKGVISAIKGTSIDVPEKEEELTQGLSQLKKLIPEYPLFHYRQMNSSLNNAVFDEYRSRDYYKAVAQGVKNMSAKCA